MNVIVDEELLEKARRFSGERTYSGALMTALKEYVRVSELNRALDMLHGVGDEAFAPGFLETYERERKQRIVVNPKKLRVSADERRLPLPTPRSDASRTVRRGCEDLPDLPG